MLQEALANEPESGLANSMVDKVQQRRWERLRAVQAQAQIHATLAVNDALWAR